MDKLFEPIRKFIKTTNLYKFQTYLEQKFSKKFLNKSKNFLEVSKTFLDISKNFLETYKIPNCFLGDL